MSGKKGNARLCAAVFSLWAAFSLWCAAAEFLLPARVTVLEGERFSCCGGVVTARASEGAMREASAVCGESYEAQLRLFDLVPIKTVRVTVSEQQYLIPGGEPFGIKLFSDGVMVVGLGPVQTAEGPFSPAEQAGIRKGDIILRMDGVKVGSNEEVASVVAASEGHAVTVQLLRQGRSIQLRLVPARASDGSGWKAGMWVRDSSAGIGTLSFLDPETGIAAGLGHGVSDVDTGELIPVRSGELVTVTVRDVTRGQSGVPGQLHGSFANSRQFAELIWNCEQGVFGLTQKESEKQPLPVAFRQSVHTGAAQILCSVQGSEPACYDVEVQSLNLSDSALVKNMVLKVTDPRLLERTGGIVQGMSGSPILQDGCIVGAVTHVFVQDPTRGYGIFIENMLAAEGQALLSLQLGDAA